MKINKPLFWDNINIISLLLLPLTLITLIVSLLGNLKIKEKLKIRTICVGNLYIGGTGKTPLAIKINEILKDNFKTVFIKKKYSDQIDEQKLLSSYGSLICSKYRIIALKQAINKKFNLAILDDGLQDKNLKYDISIVCFNSSSLAGNKFLIPAGPLRERFLKIKDYNVIFLNGDNINTKFENDLLKINPKLLIFRAKYIPKNLNSLSRKKRFLMFCGIGNPFEFELTLKKYNFKIKEILHFPDHYKYKDTDIKEIKKIANKKNLKIITTEKDYNRLSTRNKKNIEFLKIDLKIEKENKFRKYLKDNL